MVDEYSRKRLFIIAGEKLFVGKIDADQGLIEVCQVQFSSLPPIAPSISTKHSLPIMTSTTSHLFLAGGSFQSITRVNPRTKRGAVLNAEILPPTDRVGMDMSKSHIGDAVKMAFDIFGDEARVYFSNDSASWYLDGIGPSAVLGHLPRVSAQKYLPSLMKMYQSVLAFQDKTVADEESVTLSVSQLKTMAGSQAEFFAVKCRLPGIYKLQESLPKPVWLALLMLMGGSGGMPLQVDTPCARDLVIASVRLS
jgi:hypothetical protein